MNNTCINKGSEWEVVLLNKAAADLVQNTWASKSENSKEICVHTNYHRGKNFHRTGAVVQCSILVPLSCISPNFQQDNSNSVLVLLPILVFSRVIFFSSGIFSNLPLFCPLIYRAFSIALSHDLEILSQTDRPPLTVIANDPASAGSFFCFSKKVRRWLPCIPLSTGEDNHSHNLPHSLAILRLANAYLGTGIKLGE